MRQFFALWLAAFIICTAMSCRQAWALFDNYGLDSNFCNQPTVRSTVVYIDDMMMAEGQTDWATKVATKLRATVIPGERVTVVRLSPATGQSKEYWSGCWPDLPTAKKNELREGVYLFQQNPVERLVDQQKYFVRDFGAALTRVYLDAKRLPKDVHIAADSAPQKQILRALASDEGRFSNTSNTIRAIVYSDLAENSDLGSTFNPTPKDSPAFGQKLGSYLRRGVFYVYGVGEDVSGSPGYLENTRAFWNGALRSMAAVVMGLGADLNVPNSVPLRAYAWPVVMDFRGQALDGRLSLLVGEEGNLIDSWLGISRLGSAALAGTFRCSGGEDSGCRLQAETASGIATNAPTEFLNLAGSTKSLAGKLGVKGENTTFTIKTEQP